MPNNKKEIKTVDLKAYAKKQAAEKAKNPSAYTQRLEAVKIINNAAAIPIVLINKNIFLPYRSDNGR